MTVKEKAGDKRIERPDESYNIPKPLFQKSVTLQTFKHKGSGGARPSSRTFKKKVSNRSITPSKREGSKQSIGQRRRSEKTGSGLEKK